jgi:non-lysosomal glucosylceramidase
VRTLLSGLTAASLTATLLVPTAHEAAGAATGRDYWPVPGAALSSGLGVIPGSPASLGQGDSPENAPYPAGRGIPLGGIGTGSFMYNSAGSFGPWDFRNGLHEERILPQAAFHVREQVGSGTPTLRTLATKHPLGSVLPAWPTLAPGNGRYSALYPFGWTSYTPFATDVSMRFWSPIVARDDRRSSLPVAYFDVRVANRTSSNAKLSAMFTFPNAPLSVRDTKVNTRTGYYSRADADPTTGVTGVTLGASNAANVVDAQNSEWTIAARPGTGQAASYLTSWKGSGDGGDVWRDFSGSGVLSNRSLDASSSAGAVALSASLAPGQVTTLRFALAWDFPRVLFGSPGGRHTVWMKRYTSYYGGRETDTNNYVAGSYPGRRGFALADDALADEDAAYLAVRSWWQPYAESPQLPLWLRRAALNELYYTVFGSSFWESGLVENTFPSSVPQFGTPGGPRIGSQVPGTHLFFNLETTIYPNAESYDVRAYYARVIGVLWPSIERDLQRAWTEMIMQDQYGHAPHDAGRPYVPATNTTDGTSPYIVWPGYNPRQEQWLDLPAKYLQQVWQYMHDSGDREFLRQAYPAVLRSYRFLADRIPAGQHLPVSNGSDSTYDGWGLHGITSHIGGLWILAQEVTSAATTTALQMGIPGASQGLVDTIEAELPRSRAQYESVLWNPAHSWYRTSTGDAEFGAGVMADAMYGDHAARELGLPPVVDPVRLRTHLNTSYTALVAKWRDAAGRLVGAANGVNPDGSIIATGGRQAAEVWTGVAYLYAATQYLAGVQLGDATLRAHGLAAGEAVANQVWSVSSNGYAFATPEAWKVRDPRSYRALQYSRPRSVWELVFAITPPA